MDAQLINDFRVAVTTRFGHVRLYETSKSRRPLVNVEVGEHPLVALVPTAKDNEVVFCDTHATTAKFDVVSGRKIGHYSGSTGSILCLDTFLPKKVKEEEDDEEERNLMVRLPPMAQANTPLLATGGLDRYLNVYNLDTRQLVGKIYVGTKLSAVCIVDGSSTAVNGSGLSEQESEYDDGEEESSGVKVKAEKKGDKKMRKRKHVDDGTSASESGSTRSSQTKHVRFVNGSGEEDNDDDEDDADSVWQMLSEDDEDEQDLKDD